MLGILLQMFGGVLILAGLLIPYRSRTVRRRCRYIGPTVMSTIMNECSPGPHRELIVGAAVVGIGLVMLLLGRVLAKRSGLD